MSDNNTLMACLYCGDVMQRPSDEMLERFGEDTLSCCDHRMAEIDMNDMYKVVRNLDKLREHIEAEMIAGL